jgi:hypothetical protein
VVAPPTLPGGESSGGRLDGILLEDEPVIGRDFERGNTWEC